MLPAEIVPLPLALVRRRVKERRIAGQHDGRTGGAGERTDWASVFGCSIAGQVTIKCIDCSLHQELSWTAISGSRQFLVRVVDVRGPYIC